MAAGWLTVVAAVLGGRGFCACWSTGISMGLPGQRMHSGGAPYIGVYVLASLEQTNKSGSRMIKAVLYFEAGFATVFAAGFVRWFLWWNLYSVVATACKCTLCPWPLHTPLVAYMAHASPVPDKVLMRPL